MAGRTRPTAEAALAERRQQSNAEVATLAGDIRKMQSAFQLAMPRGAEATQLIRDAITCLRTTRHLAECESTSVLGGLMTCAQLGLRPAVLGHAWLLPFWSGRDRCYRATLVIGYQGYAELAYRSGRVLSLVARTVYSGDLFELEYGAEGDLMRHRPALDGVRGEPRLYYARAQVKDGGSALTDPMTRQDMEEYRDRYATAKDRNGKITGPWVSEFNGMAHKTMVRRLCKLLPKSTELATALVADDGVRVDLSPSTDAGEVTTHDVLGGEVEDTAAPAQDSGTGPGPEDIAAMNAEAAAEQADTE
jgi:recombination protein RecT